MWLGKAARMKLHEKVQSCMKLCEFTSNCVILCESHTCVIVKLHEVYELLMLNGCVETLIAVQSPALFLRIIHSHRDHSD